MDKSDYSIIVSSVMEEGKSYMCTGTDSENKYHLVCNLPLRKGDMIIGKGNVVKTSQGASIQDDDPLVIFGRNLSSFIGLFLEHVADSRIMGDYGYAKKCGYDQAEIYLNAIYAKWYASRSTDILSPRDKQLNRLSHEYKLYGVNNLSIELSAFGIPINISNIILGVWYTERYQRMLQCYRLPDSNLLYPDYEILEKMIINPFLIPSIQTDVAKSLSNRVQYEYTEQDIVCHKQTHTMYRRLSSSRKLYITDDPEDGITNYGVKYIDGKLIFTKVIDVIVNIADALEFKSNSIRLSISDDLSDDQKAAIEAIQDNPLVCIQGCAGTGKSYLIKDLYKQHFLVLTPTGTSAERLCSAGIKAATIHSSVQAIQMANYIVVDESSMVDSNTMHLLLSNAKQMRKLVLIGDPKQLQPVGWGDVFISIINSGRFPVIELRQQFRFTNDDISKFINNIRNGILESNSKAQIGLMSDDKMVSIYTDWVKNQRDIWMLSPYRNTSSKFNKLIASKLGVGDFFVGQKVICKFNYKEHHVANGSRGTVIEINNSAVIVNFSSGNVSFSKYKGERPSSNDLVMGYSSTIHSCQGQEGDYVLLDINKFSEFITSYMLFTAVSRARKGIFISSTRAVIEKILQNVPETCELMADMIRG